MKHRTTLAFIGLGIASALTLTACTSGTASNSPQAGEPTKITVWNYWDGANADAFNAMVDEFNKSQKDVVVATSTVPNADFRTKLRAAATSKTLPDIAIGDLIWVPQINEMGNLADLSTVLPSSVLSDINPALTSYGNLGGKQVSVPVSANNLEYMYNTELFKKAGLDPDKPPTTWEELKQDDEIIFKKTGLPGYDLFTQAGEDGEGLTWNFQVNLWQAGGEFLKEDNSAAAFNTDAGRKALQFWVDLIKSGASPYAKWGEFEKGKGGSAQEGSWMVGIWAPDPPFPFAAAKAPKPSDGVDATNLGGEQAMVFDNSDAKVAAAGKFLTWFLDPAQVTSWSETTGFLPVLDSVAQSPDYLTWVDSKQPALRPFVDNMKNAHARPNTALYPKISLAFAQNIEKALSGEASVDDALAAAEKAVNDVIAQG